VTIHRAVAIAAAVLFLAVSPAALSLPPALQGDPPPPPDDPAVVEMTARAQRLIDAKQYGEAEALLDQAIAKQRLSAALAQKARLVLLRGNNSPESLKQAELLLQSSRNLNFNYVPAYVMQAYVYAKLDRMPESQQAAFNAKRRGGSSEAWLVPYYIGFFDKYGPYEEATRYREILARSGPQDPKEAFEVHLALMLRYVGHDRAKADAEYDELRKLQPDNAFVPGDYARHVIFGWRDFDASERLARQALAMKDYPHARQTLSLALYGKWVDAKREGRSPEEVRALLAAAQANDPDGSQVPTCALELPGLYYVADGLRSLDLRLRRDPTQHNC
jgi:tetratricopeptide (TPR) repeat protein